MLLIKENSKRKASFNLSVSKTMVGSRVDTINLSQFCSDIVSLTSQASHTLELQQRITKL